MRAFLPMMNSISEEDEAVQEEGWIIAASLKGISMKFDSSFMPMVNALRAKYPAKVKLTLLIDAPWFLKVFMRISSVLLPKKFMDRIAVVDSKDLGRYVDPKFVPTEFGGQSTWTTQDQVLWMERYWHDCGLNKDALLEKKEDEKA